ncbi:threonine/serine exporter family protein [Nocardioides sp. AE5]|uniref:threonine/serine ThrE exporter family protein n=1 Tax=Nocardioides sp. AE5 TaxID=2962573 RepID=UPI002882049B|nr:threonine/serine exporter family protein [Nocardioides sp. AE5]MDT0203790.1 threonine/serine exporter family protein [Nocardioides sp. AE5]
MAEQSEVAHTLDLSLRIGEMLLSNGAGAADVTATMHAVAHHLGVRNPIIDVTFTSMSISYQSIEDDVPLVMMRQVKQREIDYEDLTRVDHLVRDLLGNRIDLAEARAAIARLSSSGHHRNRWAVTAGWGAMAAGVALMLGGNPLVCAIAFVAAATIDRLQIYMASYRLPTFYLQVAGGAVATLFAVAAAAAELDVDPSLVVTANIILLLSGIGFMGGLQDALTGFYVTSCARLMEALLSTGGIIAGVSGGLSVGSVLGVSVGQLEPGASDLTTIAVMGLGAAICAAAFAFASYSPKRVMIPIAVVAWVAIMISFSMRELGLGRIWGVAVAAFFIGLVTYSISGRIKVPPLVIVVSAMVPMLPGLSIYRGLALLSEGELIATGLLSLITAASVATALASGVIFGEYVAQPLRREARRMEKRLAGPRLVGPLRTRKRRSGRS